MTTAAPSRIPNTLIRASAGSGKTMALASRYVQLLIGGAASPSILATTFTRKAAGEILDRIMSNLAAAALDDRQADQVAQRMGLVDFDRPAALVALRHILTHLPQVHIGTLDSFFAKLARSLHLELGLNPDWEIADERALGQLTQTAVSSVLSHPDTRQLLHLLTKGASIRSVNQLVLDTVGDLYSIFRDANPADWFQLAALPVLSPERLAEVADTLGGLAIPDGRMAKARDSDLDRVRDGQWDEFIKKGLAAKIVDGTREYHRRPLPEELVAAYAPLIDHARGLIVNQIKGATEATHALLAKFAERFEAAKTETGLIGFEDVTRRLAELLEAADGGGLARWLYRWDGRIDHLLLDEFQDTSSIQWRVLEPFAVRVTKPNAARSFFCVGDMKQAIFGWRGGVAEVFELVERRLPGLSEESRSLSYRSAQPIMDTVNQVFENADRYESSNPLANAVIRQWQARFRPHATHKSSLPGYAVLERIDDADDCHATVAERIKSIYRRAPHRTMAVLTRDNAAVKQLIFALQSADVPASEEGGNPLTDSAAVLQILSLVQLSDHPRDSVAWYHAASGPLAAAYGVPACRLGWKDDGDALRRVAELAATIRRELSEAGYGATVARWAELLAPSSTRRELRRLQKLIELADEYDAEATLRPRDFVEFVQLRPVEDPTGSPIRVMTIHKAKGLEFDVVVLPNLSKRFEPQGRDVLVLRDSPTAPISMVAAYANSTERLLLPPEVQRAYEQQYSRGLSEAICVLYVALTRAIHALHMFVGPGDAASHQSMAGVLLATLSQVDPGGDRGPREPALLYERGDPNWMDRVDPPSTPRRAAPPASGKPPRSEAPRQIALAKPATHSWRNVPTIHPSHLTARARGTIGQALRSAAEPAATDRGSMLHACFAQVHWLDDGTWRDGLLENLRQKFPNQPDREEIVAEFARIVRQPMVSAILSRVSYAEQIAGRVLPSQIVFEPLRAVAQNEWPFAVRLDQSVLAGTIDRLVSIYEGNSLIGAEIIEYKTDRLDENDEAEIARQVAAYRPQIDAYRRAVAQWTGLAHPRVLARLLWVGIDRVCEVR